MGTIEELIYEATAAELPKPDNKMISDIIDHIKQNPGDVEEAANAILQRLKDQDVKIQMLTLFLLDKSMKSLGNNFSQAIGNRQFMNVFVMTVTDPDTIDQLK